MSSLCRIIMRLLPSLLISVVVAADALVAPISSSSSSSSIQRTTNTRTATPRQYHPGMRHQTTSTTTTAKPFHRRLSSSLSSSSSSLWLATTDSSEGGGGEEEDTPTNNDDNNNNEVPRGGGGMIGTGAGGTINVSKQSPPALPTLADYRKFALPCLGLWVSQPLLSLVDTAFVGLSGTVSQSASNLAALGPATTFIDGATYLFAFLNVATTNLYSSARAQRGEQSDQAEGVVRTANRISFRCGVGLMIFLWAFARPLLALYIGTNKALLRLCGRRLVSDAFVNLLVLVCPFYLDSSSYICRVSMKIATFKSCLLTLIHTLSQSQKYIHAYMHAIIHTHTHRS
jgi:hypothetical protein